MFVTLIEPLQHLNPLLCLLFVFFFFLSCVSLCTSYFRYIEIFKSSRNEIRAYYEVPRRGMGAQRPGPYDRPMMSGPRGGFFGPSPGRGATMMDNMRSGGGYGGGKQFLSDPVEKDLQLYSE